VSSAFFCFCGDFSDFFLAMICFVLNHKIVSTSTITSPVSAARTKAMMVGILWGAGTMCPFTVKAEQKISSTEGKFQAVLANVDYFGAAVASYHQTPPPSPAAMLGLRALW
jgi:hypothetical protein